MRCPDCKHQQKYKDGMRCPKCSYAFTLCKKTDGLSDDALRRIILSLTRSVQFRSVEKLSAYQMDGVPGAHHGLKLWMPITFLLWHEQMVETPFPIRSPAPPSRVLEATAIEH